MSRCARRLAQAVLIVGIAVALPSPAPAKPTCSTGGPFCSQSSNPCMSYCQSIGWPLGLCNFQTACCLCTD